jgi:iron complex transport system substrate-binding protein
MQSKALHYSFCVLLVLISLPTVHVEVSATDDLGRAVKLVTIPCRIVSLAPSITETLFAIGAGNQVVGVTDFCNYPAEATRKRRVGGITNPSIETIVGLKPDLIILSMEGNVREDFDKLLEVGVPVFVTNPRSLFGIHKSIRDLGLLTGNVGSASRLVEAMRQREDSLASLTRLAQRVLLIVSLQPLIVAGNKTFLSELLTLAGGVNIVGTSLSTFPTLSRETVVAADPEVIIVMSDVLTDTNELQKFFPEWSTLRALKTHRVFRINSDLVARPGPRAVEGLIALYTIIHARPSGGQEGHE